MAIACPDCGSIQELPALPARATASCRGCGNALERTAGRSISAALALSLTTLLLLGAAMSLPFLSVNMLGMSRATHIYSVIGLLLKSQWVLLAVGVTAFIVVLPLLRFALLVVVLGAIRFGFRPAWLGPAFRYAISMDLWSMPDVLLIGSFIGYTRLNMDLPTHIGAGGWCFIGAAALSMIAHASLDRRTVWRAIGHDREIPRNRPAISCSACDLAVSASAEGGRCPRCRGRLHARKPDALVRTAALVCAGLILYPAANIWPMTILSRLGATEPHTIFYGMKRLAEVGLWPFAIIIFITSIAIPLLKLAALAWCVLSVRFRWRRALAFRTRLYHYVDGLGRWSNVDIMIIAVFAPLMQFGRLVSVHVGIGATCFFAVVVVTMLASRCFDARLMWDAVGSGP